MSNPQAPTTAPHPRRRSTDHPTQPTFADLATPIAQAATGMTQHLWGLPFDLLRTQYATAVRAGWLERSMLASGRFERNLRALEQLTYGPFARQV